MGPRRYELVFEREHEPARPEALDFTPRVYRRREGDLRKGRATLPWDVVGDALAQLQERSRAASDQTAPRRRIGEVLRVFLEDIHGSLPEADLVRSAAKDEGPAIITVRSSAPELYVLPWELCTLPACGLYLADLPDVLVRYEWPGPPLPPQVAGEGAPRIVFAWSSAGDVVPEVDHRKHIQEALARMPGVVLEEVPEVSGRSLEAALAKGGGPTVLHILCHGSLRGPKEAPHAVLLCGEDAIDVDRLRGLLAPRLAGLRMVVLSACSGGDSDPSNLYVGSLAQAVHRLGVPAVVASRYPLSVRGSIRLTRVLYGALLGGASVEEALLRTRAALMKEDDEGDGYGNCSADAYALQLYARSEEAVRDVEGKEARRDVTATWPFARVAVRAPFFAAPAAAPAADVHISRLPSTGRDLFGREAELAWLDACWAEGVRVASIVASGGVGKSSLVNEWLRRMDGDGWRRATRVYGWSFYSQGTDRLASSDEFFADALRRFGDTGEAPRSPWEKGERLAALVRKDRALLVLDGVEPLQWGPGMQEGKLKDPALLALVKELGGQNRGLCVITSRIALTELEGVGGDKVQVRDLGSLSSEAGAELLKARGAKGAEEELREAAREYKGHGLALTLLGSYLADVANGDIRRRQQIGPLQDEERFGGHARRVMRSYEKWLGKLESAILHMIGLFDRPADDEEIAVLRALPEIKGPMAKLSKVNESEWRKAVAKLVRVGLLAHQDKKLDAHPLVRQHYGEQLKRKQPEAWREGHRRLYEHLKERAKPLPETVEEMAPLYAAVVHGCQAGKNQEALVDIVWKRVYRKTAGFNWRKLGAFGSGVAVYSAFFDPPWERLAPGLDTVWQAWALNEAGFSLRALGRLPEAVALVRLGLERDIAREDWENASIAASNLSDLLQARGDLGAALAQARKSVELGDKSRDAFQRMARRAVLAAALYATGLREEAAAQFEEAERMQKEQQPDYPLLYSLAGFRYCDLLLDQDRDAEVWERAAQTLTLVEANGDLLSIALDHLSLGRAHLLAAQRGAAGDLSEAASQLQQAVDGFRSGGRQDYLPLGLLARAALHTHTRAFADARRDLDEALTLAERCGFRLHEADAHVGLARLALAEGHPTEARDHLAIARRIVDATGYHRRDAELAALEAEAAAPPPPAPPEGPRPGGAAGYPERTVRASSIR